MERDILIRLAALENIDESLYNMLLAKLNNTPISLFPDANRATPRDMLRLYALVLSQRESQLAMAEFTRVCVDKSTHEYKGELTALRVKHDAYVESITPLIKDQVQQLKRSHAQISELKDQMNTLKFQHDRMAAEHKQMQQELTQEREKRHCLRPTYRVLSTSLDTESLTPEVKEALNVFQNMLKN
jgi:hypothetical protein